MPALGPSWVVAIAHPEEAPVASRRKKRRKARHARVIAVHNPRERPRQIWLVVRSGLQLIELLFGHDHGLYLAVQAVIAVGNLAVYSIQKLNR
jgi:hypothetical protein